MRGRRRQRKKQMKRWHAKLRAADDTVAVFREVAMAATLRLVRIANEREMEEEIHAT